VTPTDVLLTAIADHLRNDVQPALEGFTAYQNRVATNLLALLAREARLGPARAARDACFARDRGLDPDDPLPDLARRLRDGREEVDDALLVFLRERCLGTLIIDNPRYAGLATARRRWPTLATRVDAEAAEPGVDESTDSVAGSPKA
jgi:hypothetical protein